MNKNATKRSLLASVMALVLCVAMLVGTTFAWFTDTASTSVNKIVSGKLNVALEMKTGEVDDEGNPVWVDAEGQTLQFKKAGDAAEQVLWEPGCRYELPELRVVNKGNLALKYKLQITGITGDAKLNEVIDWTINGADISLTEQHLAALQAGDGFVIKGVMQTTAGNEYQNLSIDGIGITVYATQDTVESDSFDRTYDAGATYPMEIIPAIDNEPMTKNGSKFEYSNSDGTVEMSVPERAVSDEATPYVTVKPLNGGNIFVTAEEKNALGYDITITNIKPDNTELFTVALKVGKGLQNVGIKHDTLAMTEVGSLAALNAADTYYYDSAAGVLTMAITHCSEFHIVFDVPVASIGSTDYYSFEEAIKAAKGGDTVLLHKNVVVEDMTLRCENVTILGSGNTQREIKGIKAIAGSGMTLKNIYLNLTCTLDIGGSNTTLENITIRPKDLTYNEAWNNYSFDGEEGANGAWYEPMTKITGMGANLKNVEFNGTAKVTADSPQNYFGELCLAMVNGTDVSMTGCTFYEGTTACGNSNPKGTWTLKDCKFSRIYESSLEVIGNGAENTIQVENCDLVACCDLNNRNSHISFKDSRFGKTANYNSFCYGIYTYAKNTVLSGCTFTEDYKFGAADHDTREAGGLFFGDDVVMELNNCSVIDGAGAPIAGRLATVIWKETYNNSGIAAVDATKDNAGKFTAGTFVGSKNAVEAKLAEGYTVEQNGNDGIWTVIEKA